MRVAGAFAEGPDIRSGKQAHVAGLGFLDEFGGSGRHHFVAEITMAGQTLRSLAYPIRARRPCHFSLNSRQQQPRREGFAVEADLLGALEWDELRDAGNFKSRDAGLF